MVGKPPCRMHIHPGVALLSCLVSVTDFTLFPKCTKCAAPESNARHSAPLNAINAAAITIVSGIGRKMETAQAT